MKKQKRKTDHDMVLLTGMVSKVFNKQIEVLVEDDTITCILPGALLAKKNSIVVGDIVQLGLSGARQYKLVEVIPRRTEVYRGNRRSPGDEILITANVDQVLTVVTADYLLHQAGYFENAVIAARRADLEIILYVSKWDAVSEQAQELLSEKISLYRTTADSVFVGTPEFLDNRLIEAVTGKSTVVIGDRASGKTTLIRKIMNQLGNGEFSYGDLSSTHTSNIFVGSNETVFIDTPGFRDFALQKITEEELEVAFPEIVEVAENCGFNNCTHTHEDNCAVVRGLQERKIGRERFSVYQKLSGVVTLSAPKIDYRHNSCEESFVCKVCGNLVTPYSAGTQHRNHCPHCLSSIHVDNEPGDRASLCHGIMDPIGVWVRKDGEWAIIHRCRTCGTLGSNRIAADDSPMLLMSIAVKPLSSPPFPLSQLENAAK